MATQLKTAEAAAPAEPVTSMPLSEPPTPCRSPRRVDPLTEEINQMMLARGKSFDSLASSSEGPPSQAAMTGHPKKQQEDEQMQCPQESRDDHKDSSHTREHTQHPQQPVSQPVEIKQQQQTQEPPEKPAEEPTMHMEPQQDPGCVEVQQGETSAAPDASPNESNMDQRQQQMVQESRDDQKDSNPHEHTEHLQQPVSEIKQQQQTQEPPQKPAEEPRGKCPARGDSGQAGAA